jgi:hypothetical protein
MPGPWDVGRQPQASISGTSVKPTGAAQTAAGNPAFRDGSTARHYLPPRRCRFQTQRHSFRLRPRSPVRSTAPGLNYGTEDFPVHTEWHHRRLPILCRFKVFPFPAVDVSRFKRSPSRSSRFRRPSDRDLAQEQPVLFGGRRWGDARLYPIVMPRTTARRLPSR